MSCSKDESSGDSKKVSAIVDGTSFSMAQTEGISSAIAIGSMQINAININNKGFQFFLGETPEAKNYDLSTSSISVIYTPDRSSFKNYRIKRGNLDISNVSKSPIVFEATFSGWAFLTTNSSDSLEITDGVANVAF